jgi:hypothetical protein
MFILAELHQQEDKILSLKDSLDYIVNSIKAVEKFIYYIMHPTKIFTFFWHITLEYSYFICLTICIVSVLLYVFGSKKCGKYATISLGVYTVIQAVGSALK